MSPDGLNSPNSPQKIDYPNYTSFSKKAIKLDYIFQNHLNKTLIEDVKCENFSLVHSKTKKAKFSVWINLKESPYILKIFLQRGTYNI